jgi:hypothetical protein
MLNSVLLILRALQALAATVVGCARAAAAPLGGARAQARMTETCWVNGESKSAHQLLVKVLAAFTWD